jgi:hypothetical protein
MKKLTRIAILIKSYGGIKAFRGVFSNIPEQTVKKWSGCFQEPPEWAADLIEEKLKG